MSKTYLSIHASGEGKLGVTLCLTNGGNVKQSELVSDFEHVGKSVVEMSKVPYMEFESFEVCEHEIAFIKRQCEEEWSEYSIR